MEMGEVCKLGTQITDAEDCRDAVSYASALSITLGSRNTLVGPGDWGHVPKGCSYLAGHDHAFHFNTKDGINDGGYRMICKRGKKLIKFSIFRMIKNQATIEVFIMHVGIKIEFFR